MLAMLLNNYASLLERTGRFREALEAYREAAELRRKLLKEHGENAEWRRLLATTNSNLAMLAGRLGEHRQAGEAFREALQVLRQLVADYPGHVGYRQDLAICANACGNWLLRQGQEPQAEAAYLEALASYALLLKRFPNHYDWRLELALCHNNLGSLCRRTGRYSEAAHYYRQCLTLYGQLARESPQRFDVQENLATVYHNLAVLCYQQERYREARVACCEALAVLQKLIRGPGEQQDVQALKGKCWNLLGSVEIRLGDTQDAEPCFRQALGVLQHLATVNSDSKAFHADLAEAHNNFAILLLLQNRLDEAEAHLWQALACIREAGGKGLLGPASGSDFAARILESLARVQERRGNWSQARSLLEESAREARRSLQACPDNAVVGQLGQRVHTSWVLACARTEEWSAALEAAKRLENLGWREGPDAYAAACALAQCLPLIRQTNSLRPEQKQAVVDQYESETLRLLEKAIRAGLPNAALLDRDVFAPLHEHPRFIKLRQSVRKTRPDI